MWSVLEGMTAGTYPYCQYTSVDMDSPEQYKVQVQGIHLFACVRAFLFAYKEMGICSTINSPDVNMNKLRFNK